MREAQSKGIKYFRILHREELEEVLGYYQMGGSENAAAILRVQEKAQKRWKAGWGTKETLGAAKKQGKKK